MARARFGREIYDSASLANESIACSPYEPYQWSRGQEWNSARQREGHMKLLTFEHNGNRHIGALLADSGMISDFTASEPSASHFRDMLSLIDSGAEGIGGSSPSGRKTKKFKCLIPRGVCGLLFPNRDRCEIFCALRNI